MQKWKQITKKQPDQKMVTVDGNYARIIGIVCLSVSGVLHCDYFAVECQRVWFIYIGMLASVAMPHILPLLRAMRM